jgi:hypothetical protein
MGEAGLFSERVRPPVDTTIYFIKRREGDYYDGSI